MRKDEKPWLNLNLPLHDVTEMLHPYPGSEMNAYPISTEIKSPRAHGIDLLQPTGQRIYKEYDYVIYEDIQLQGMGSTNARIRKQDEDPPTLFDIE